MSLLPDSFAGLVIHSLWLILPASAAGMLFLPRARRAFDRLADQKAAIAEKEPVQASSAVWRWDDIPARCPAKDAGKAYPQTVHSVEAIPFERLVEENAGQIRQFLELMPVTVAQTERFVMPVLANTLRYVHLLPASQWDHHAGRGGLLAHSLEVAIGCVKAARSKDYPFRDAETPEQIYANKELWIVVCGLAGLLHDVGKTCDMRITALPDDPKVEGQVWDPTRETLLDWASREKIGSYFIGWKKRQYSAQEGDLRDHERRSLLIALKLLVPSATIDWIASCNGMHLLDEFQKSLEGDRSSLARGWVQAADEKSVSDDKAIRGAIAPSDRVIASPVAEPILRAVQALVNSRQWLVNSSAENGFVFATDRGVFLLYSDKAAADIRSKAVEQGFGSVPQSVQAQARILADEGIALATDESQRTGPDWEGVAAWIWKASFLPCGVEQFMCLRLDDSRRIFPEFMPDPVPAAVSGQALSDSQKTAWLQGCGKVPETDEKQGPEDPDRACAGKPQKSKAAISGQGDPAKSKPSPGHSFVQDLEAVCKEDAMQESALSAVFGSGKRKSSGRNAPTEKNGAAQSLKTEPRTALALQPESVPAQDCRKSSVEAAAAKPCPKLEKVAFVSSGAGMGQPGGENAYGSISLTSDEIPALLMEEAPVAASKEEVRAFAELMGASLLAQWKARHGWLLGDLRKDCPSSVPASQMLAAAQRRKIDRKSLSILVSQRLVRERAGIVYNRTAELFAMNSERNQ